MSVEEAFAIGAGILIVGAMLLVGFGMWILFFTDELDESLDYGNEVGNNDDKQDRYSRKEYE